jgi:alkylated DNA nucleotide flippase Atl1
VLARIEQNSGEELERMLNRIPLGRVTRHGLLATAMGTTPRAVAPTVCRSTSNGRIHVVLKGGRLPDNFKDCLKRARILENEGVPICEDRRRVLVAEEDIWRP